MNLSEFETSIINILLLAVSMDSETKIKLEIKPVDQSLKNPGYNIVSYETDSNIIHIWPYNKTCLAYKNLKENNFTDLGFLQELLDMLNVLMGPYTKQYQDIILSLINAPN